MPPEYQHPARDLVTRRDFIGKAAAGAAGGLLFSQLGCGPGEKSAGQPQVAVAPSGYDYAKWDEIFQTIVRGFVRNALRTSDSFAVCDYRDGTRLENFVTPGGGKTCDSVTRILPALAARIASPDGQQALEVDGRLFELADIFTSALKAGTDPQGQDFWGYAPASGSNQRQVESSSVAFSLWLVSGQLMDRFTPGERKNIQDWLASCTVVPVRGNNWALFTAVNHAARLALSERWPEFRGDANFFQEDLAVIDRMYAGDGWYHDSLDGNEFDYYNFWVFASHTLYWDMLVG